MPDVEGPGDKGTSEKEALGAAKVQARMCPGQGRDSWSRKETRSGTRREFPF